MNIHIMNTLPSATPKQREETSIFQIVVLLNHVGGSSDPYADAYA